MHFASIKPDDIAIVKGGAFIRIGEILKRQGLLPQGATMIDFISRYDAIKDSIGQVAAQGASTPADPKLLKAPVERPSKVWAAATNYKRGASGIDSSAGRGEAQSLTAEATREMAFLKPPSAVVGPEQAIVIPRGADTIFPELELCVVIGKPSRSVSKGDAFDAVFGYTIILDVTARGYGANKNLVATRCVRKGFDTFAPIGPWIATRDEIKDPQNLGMKLWVNGELRQSAKTSGMINGVAELVSYLSEVGTLYPGDLIATGNPDAPEFQQQLAPGDVLKAEIEGIGAVEFRVDRAP